MNKLFDFAKEWSGLVALAIGLMSLFQAPYEIYEKYFRSPQEKIDQKIQELRTSIDSLASISFECGRTLSGIKDPVFIDVIATSCNTRKYLILKRNDELFEKNINSLSLTELNVLGYNFFEQAEISQALKYFKLAESKSPDGSPNKIESIRQIGKILFMNSKDQDIPTGRKYFRRIIEALDRTITPQDLFRKIYIRSEWGLAELQFGDWKCGQMQITESKRELDSNKNSLQTNGQILNDLVEHATKSLTPYPNQRMTGCDV